jgi:hypothetical protein
VADAFGQALLDHDSGGREHPLRQCDGEAELIHPVGEFYFDAFADQPGAQFVQSWLDGPLLDVGAGAGRDALAFQDRFEVVALEISEHLVTLMDERGVRDPRQGDMFALPEQFEPGRFHSALVLGTQMGLAKSMAGLTDFLNDLATITDGTATAVLDGYDPTYEGAREMLGFRADATPGLGFRVIRYEYGDLVGDTLLFRLFSPDRLREAAAATNWTVAEVHRPHDAYYYQAALSK